MSSTLDKIQGLNTSLENGNSIEFDLDGYISKFIKIRTPDYKGENKTTTDKINYLKGIDTSSKYNPENMKIFLDEYYSSLKGAIEKTTTLKPMEPVKTDVVGNINNKQPNSTPDDTDLSLQNKKLDRFNGTFGEEQESSGCGRHALNNLLGHAYFTGYNNKINDNPYTLVELKDIIENITGKHLNLHNLCKYLTIRDNEKEKIIMKYDNQNDCPKEENYDINVLIAALELIGFEINKPFQLKEGETSNIDEAPNIDDPKVFGLLINIGGSHWVSARKYKETIYYMNSLEKDNVITEIGKVALNVIITGVENATIMGTENTTIIGAKNTTYLIKNTGNPKIAFINLKIDDFIRTQIKDPDKKKLYYEKPYSNYIKELKDEKIINNLYNKQFQYSPELTSLIEKDTNGEEILEKLVEEPKTKNDTPTKQHDTRSKNQDKNKQKTITKTKQQTKKNKSQKKRS